MVDAEGFDRSDRLLQLIDSVKEVKENDRLARVRVDSILSLLGV